MRSPILFALFAFATLLPSSAAAEPPNIVFIMVDDLGKEWVGCYGAEGIETPHIDRLAENGLRFTNVYSMPQCTPTRATLLTGQYPFRHGWVNHWDVPRWGRGCHFDPERNPCVARVLKAAGYRTAIAGKWQINDFRVQPNVLKDLGFDEWCMWTGYEAGNKPSAERYYSPYLCTSPPLTDGVVSKTYKDGFGPDICNNFLCDFVSRQSSETPFFIYYPMILTHGPLTSTPAEPNVTGKERHAAMVRHTDTLVGRLVESLEKRGLLENTLVVWTTDNGTSGGIQNRMDGRLVRGAKGRTTENGCCEPFIVSGPGVPRGKVSHALHDFTDLLPTFADFANAKLPEGYTYDGKSLKQVYLGKSEFGPREWMMAMGGGAGTYDPQTGRVINRHVYRDRVIRDRQYKVTVGTDRKPQKLVDLETDPDEKVNRLNDPELADVLKRLMSYEATFPAEDNSLRHEPLKPQPWDIVQSNPGRSGAGGGSPKPKRERRKNRKPKTD